VSFLKDLTVKRFYSLTWTGSRGEFVSSRAHFRSPESLVSATDSLSYVRSRVLSLSGGRRFSHSCKRPLKDSANLKSQSRLNRYKDIFFTSLGVFFLKALILGAFLEKFAASRNLPSPFSIYPANFKLISKFNKIKSCRLVHTLDLYELRRFIC
jgi:hypothetical protein